MACAEARPETLSPTLGWLLETPQATNCPIGSPEGQAPGFLPESAAWKLGGLDLPQGVWAHFLLNPVLCTGQQPHLSPPNTWAPRCQRKLLLSWRKEVLRPGAGLSPSLPA